MAGLHSAPRSRIVAPVNGAPFAFEVAYRKGIELCGHGLWLDPRGSRPLAFVSHAHSDHLGRHREVIATPGTIRLMRERLGRGRRREHPVAFGEPFSLPQLPGVRIELLPAGHIVGSAQIYLEAEGEVGRPGGVGGSLLYTGDFKLRASFCAERATWRHAETLVMETTFGKPRYRMPPADEVIAQIVDFCRQTVAEGATPVLLAYSLGKAQEAVWALLGAGLVPALHDTVFRMTEICRTLVPEFPGGYVRHGVEREAAAAAGGGTVFICPPSLARTPAVRGIPRRRVAVLTGWALDPGAPYRYGADVAFPLSDHADYDELLRTVELVRPRRVLTLHGFAAAFAADLRARGVEAWAINEANQLELALEREF